MHQCTEMTEYNRNEFSTVNILRYIDKIQHIFAVGKVIIHWNVKNRYDFAHEFIIYLLTESAE